MFTLSLLKVSSETSFVLQSFLLGLSIGREVRVTNFIRVPQSSIFSEYFAGMDKTSLDFTIYQDFNLTITVAFLVINIAITSHRLCRKREEGNSSFKRKVNGKVVQSNFKNLSNGEMSLLRLIFSIENTIRMTVYLTNVSKHLNIDRINLFTDYFLLAFVVVN